MNAVPLVRIRVALACALEAYSFPDRDYTYTLFSSNLPVCLAQ